MGLSSVVYNTVFKRTSTFALAIITSAFFFERAVDHGVDIFFDIHNEGVCYITSLQ